MVNPSESEQKTAEIFIPWAGGSVRIRYQNEHTVRVHGSYRHRKDLDGVNRETGNFVYSLYKGVEVETPGGWKPLVPLALIDNEDTGDLRTLFLGRDPDANGEPAVYSGPDGAPDWDLISSAKELGIPVTGED